MKKLILVFVMWPMMVSVFGQNQRKSITDTVFQLDQAIVKETIKKKVNLLNLDVHLKTFDQPFHFLNESHDLPLELKHYYE